MKLSKETLEVLKNFAIINSSILIQKGKNLVTISNSKTVLANAAIKEDFKISFGIYDVGSFLATLTLFEEPELIFKGNRFMSIKDAKSKASCKFFFVDETIIKKPPVNELTLNTEDVKFNISETDLAKILKASQVLSLEDIIITNEDGKIIITACDIKNPAANTYSLEVADSDIKDEFKLVIKTEKLRMLPGDYSVSIQAQGDAFLSYFYNTTLDAKYWIALESKSTFG